MYLQSRGPEAPAFTLDEREALGLDQMPRTSLMAWFMFQETQELVL